MISLPNDLVVLVVEDSEAFRDSVVYEFETLGVVCLTAQHGEEALTILNTCRVDVVISDARMPRMDGITLLDTMRIKNILTPFILMSGFTEIPIYEAFDRGASAFVSKPFDISEVADQVRRLAISREQAWGEPQPEPKVDIFLRCMDEAHASSTVGIALGRGGFFLGEVPARSGRGTSVGFRIEIHGGLILDGVGVIQWVRESRSDSLPIGCGIEFWYLTPESRASVIRLIDDKRPKAYIPKGPSH